MINYRVANLKKMLAQLKKQRVWVDSKIEESEFGKFGWIKDGEGNRIELWEPPKDAKRARSPNQFVFPRSISSLAIPAD